MRGSTLTCRERNEMMRAKLCKTIKDIKELIERDYSMISGEKVRNIFAEDVVKVIEKRSKDSRNFESGQVMWFAVDKNDSWSYSKNAKKH